jgi:hypothetical protein
MLMPRRQQTQMGVWLTEKLGDEAKHAIPQQERRRNLTRLARGLRAYSHNSTNSSSPSSKNWYTCDG